MSKVDNYTVSRKLERIRARRRFVNGLPAIFHDLGMIVAFTVPPLGFILTVWAGIWLVSTL